jgi:hypothetical protein
MVFCCVELAVGLATDVRVAQASLQHAWPSGDTVYTIQCTYTPMRAHVAAATQGLEGAVQAVTATSCHRPKGTSLIAL